MDVPLAVNTPAAEPALAPPAALPPRAAAVSAERVLAPVYARGDRWMRAFVAFHLAVAAALAPVHGTELATFAVAPVLALAFYACAWLHPRTRLTRVVAGVVLQGFCALHIFQMAGLAEMHFWFFTAVTMMVVYQDWRAIWPGVLAIIAQHTLFAHWHNQGAHPGGVHFFEGDEIGALKLTLHYGIALVQVGVASYWAHLLRVQTLGNAESHARLAAANAALLERQRESDETNERLQDQAAELEIQAAHLQEQTAELEAANDELHAATLELEAQRDALGESEARLRLAQHAARAGVWDGDLETGRMTWSPEFFALYGLDPVRVRPSMAAWLDCVHPDDRARVEAETRAAFAEGREQYTEFRIVTRGDGERPFRWVASVGRVVERVDGRPRRVAGLAIDITDRVRAQEEHRAAEARFRRVTDSDLVGVLFWSADGRIAGANDAFLRMIGRTREELERGRIDWQALTPPEWAAQDEACIAELRATGTTRPFEKEYLRPDGSRVPVLAHAATYEHTRDEGVAIVLDLSARRRTEAERDALLARALEARAEAEAANLSKSRFLATMSHELRTPLNAIAGYADLLQLEIQGTITAGQRDYLERIQRAKQHLLGLINDVLDFARIEAGRLELHLSDFLVEPLVADVGSLVAPLAEAKQLRLVHAGGPALRVRADRDRTRQVVLNLLANAVKFTEGEGRVEVGWTADGDALLLHVRDTGRGIPPEMLEEVFEPFVQVEPTLSRTAQGTGLGLAISRELARSMGGDLRAESEPGRGSTFTLRLPLADPAG